MFWKAILGMVKVHRALLPAADRLLGQKRGVVTGLDGNPYVEYRRPMVLLALLCAGAACIALALSAKDTSTGAGTLVGGLVTLYILARKRLRRH